MPYFCLFLSLSLTLLLSHNALDPPALSLCISLAVIYVQAACRVSACLYGRALALQLHARSVARIAGRLRVPAIGGGSRYIVHSRVQNDSSQRATLAEHAFEGQFGPMWYKSKPFALPRLTP